MTHDELMDARITVKHSSNDDMSANAAPGWYAFVQLDDREAACYGPFRTRLAARRRGFVRLSEELPDCLA